MLKLIWSNYQWCPVPLKGMVEAVCRDIKDSLGSFVRRISFALISASLENRCKTFSSHAAMSLTFWLGQTFFFEIYWRICFWCPMLVMWNLIQMCVHILRVNGLSLKGTRCLGSVELVFENRLKPFVTKCIWLDRQFKSRKQWSTQNCLKIARFSFDVVNKHGWPFVELQNKILTPYNGQPCMLHWSVLIPLTNN